jgi:hypothetical protein
VRDALIDKFSDKSLEELNAFISVALETEQDEAKRLGVLAARVHILRMRISNVSAFNNDPTMTAIPTLTTGDLLGERPSPLNAEDIGEDDADFNPDKFEEWTELRIIEDGEINGVRFPKDAIITVGPFDAYRLLKTEKANYLTQPEAMDGSDKIIAEVKDEDQLDQELSTLSSDDDDIEGAADTEPQESDPEVDTTLSPDAPSEEAEALDNDTQDDDIEGAADTEPQESDPEVDTTLSPDAPSEEAEALDNDTQDDNIGAEDGIDPLANR